MPLGFSTLRGNNGGDFNKRKVIATMKCLTWFDSFPVQVLESGAMEEPTNNKAASVCLLTHAENGTYYLHTKTTFGVTL